MTRFVKYIKAWFHIPWGYYCYSHSWNHRKRKHCKYHSIDPTREYQHNGYCSYLGMGDWNLYDDVDITESTIIRDEQGNEVSSDVRTVKGRDMEFPFSLLWDSCKECHIKTKKPWSRW